MTTEPAPKLGQRHFQMILLFTAILIVYFSRGNASIAIVAMTNSADTNPNFVQYDWSLKERSYVLSSFYWGYILTQLVGGWLAYRYGVRRTLLVSIFVPSILILLPPFCVSWGGWQIYCFIRFLMGLFQGFFFPAMHAHIVSWSAPKERNLFGALVYSALDCGLLITMFGSGAIATSPLGWPGIFYVSAGSGFIWCAIWFIFGADTPNDSHLISPVELNYIESAKLAQEETRSNKIPVPWCAMLSSVPFWAVFIVRCTQHWSSMTLQFEMPSYLSSALSMDMKKNKFYSALPYFVAWPNDYICLIIAEMILRRRICSLTVLRKTYNTIASCGPALCLIAIGFLNENQMTLAVLLLTVGTFLLVPGTIGSTLNTIDISTHHTGIVMGFVNSGESFFALVNPLVVATIVRDEHDRDQWQMVFYLAAFILVAGNLIYAIFGQMVSQPWDAEDYLTKCREQKRNKRIYNSHRSAI